MSPPSTNQSSPVSAELVRQLLNGVDKFDLKLKQLGALHAIQDVRAIERLHTWYPGQRAELDFTKYGVFLYPNANWNHPVLYQDGMGVDHASGVVGSCLISASPSAADVVRLYRRLVMPKAIWLPESLRSSAQEWDVFGLPLLLALDNGADFMSNAALLVYMLTGTILLRVPPRRGDLKAVVERTQGTFETRFVSGLQGYVPRKYVGLNPRYTKQRERAMAAAKLTVAEYEKKVLDNILEFNHEPHPRLQRRRMDVYRSGLELAPPLLLTGRLQQRATFALTYEVQLTREGVQVENLKFNSDALFDSYLTYTGRVIVKLDPDDIRAVLVFVPKQTSGKPVEAFLTTFSYDEGPITLELYRLTRRSHEAEMQARGRFEVKDVPYVFEQQLERVQSFSAPSVPTTTARKETQAAVHAAALPQVQETKRGLSEGQSLADLLGASRLTDE